MPTISRHKEIIVCTQCSGNRRFRIRQRLGDDVIKPCEHCNELGVVYQTIIVNHEPITNTEELYKLI